MPLANPIFQVFLDVRRLENAEVEDSEMESSELEMVVDLHAEKPDVELECEDGELKCEDGESKCEDEESGCEDGESGCEDEESGCEGEEFGCEVVELECQEVELEYAKATKMASAKIELNDVDGKQDLPCHLCVDSRWVRHGACIPHCLKEDNVSHI